MGRAPLEAAAWSAALSAMFLAVYGFANAVADGRADVGTWYFAWELRIPFVPWLIVPYVSIDLFFVASFFLFETTEGLRAHARRVALAIAVAGVCFVLFPLRTAYPRPEVSGWAGALYGALWRLDRPHNLAPSLHVALLVLLWTAYVPRARGVVRRALECWFALVAASTLLTWQHHVLDVVTGAALGVACCFAAPDPPRERLASGRGARVGARYAGGAVVCLAAAASVGGWAWLLAWPAAALGAVAWAYVAGRPDALGKRDGRVSWAARVVLAPYHAGARAAWRWHSRGRPAWSRVAEGVYVGRRPRPGEVERLGVAAVLDLTAEAPAPPLPPSVVYANVPILDLVAPSPEQLGRAVAFVREHAPRGVYVHCALGRSRAPAVAAAYLAGRSP